MSSSSAPHALALARSATQSVREAANGCKVQALKDEGHGFAQKAQEILSKIEEKVGVLLRCSCRNANLSTIVQGYPHSAPDSNVKPSRSCITYGAPLQCMRHVSTCSGAVQVPTCAWAGFLNCMRAAVLSGSICFKSSRGTGS